MKIPGVKPIYRYKLLAKPNMNDFAVFDMKTGEIVTKDNLSRDIAEEKLRELTDLAISEEKKRGRAIPIGYS